MEIRGDSVSEPAQPRGANFGEARNRKSQNEAAANGNINTIAGTGTPGYNGNGLAALSTNLDGLDGLVVTSKGVFVADTAQNRVRKIH